MNCPKCGNELNENQKFCSNCGYKNSDDLISKIFNSKEIIIPIVSVVLILTSCIAIAVHNDTKHFDNNAITENNSNDTETEEMEEYSEEESPAVKLAPKPKCIYETSDGVCFTTQIFKIEPMHYYDCTGGLTTYNRTNSAGEETRNYGINECNYMYDSWAGANKACKDWGYKLPNTEELDSLAKDIYSAIISDEPNEFTYLPPNKKVNLSPLKLLSPTYDYDKGRVLELWEDLEIDATRSYSREFNIGHKLAHPAYTYTRREATFRDYYIPFRVDSSVCVYDPYGVAKKTYTIPKIVTTPPKVQTPVKENNVQEAENALF